MNLLNPEKFGSLDSFLEQFGDLKDSSQVVQLHEILKGLLLRRMKEDVEKSLAPKVNFIRVWILNATGGDSD